MNSHHAISSLLALLLLGCPAVGHSATTFTEWNFNASDLTPSTGSGTASLHGGTSASFISGGWNTASYASQSSGSGTRGIQMMVSTTGYQNVVFSFDHRASPAASRWAQVDYTLDGTNWVTGFWNNGGGLSPEDTFYSFNVDFTSVVGASDNPNFGVRVVSIFSPLAFDQNSSLVDYSANTAYMRASSDASYTPDGGLGAGSYATNGTWRFDNVAFAGVAIPEPSRVLLIGLAALGLAIRRRR